MPSPVARMRWLRSKLYSLRVGTGAAIMPPNVSKLLLNFNYNTAKGHMGAKKFWKECLPRLKFHNPNVDMEVIRSRDADIPATLTIHFSETAASNTPTEGSSTTPVQDSVKIDMQNKFAEDIMEELVSKTSATPYTEPRRSQELEDEAEYLVRKREKKADEKLKAMKSRKKSYNEKYRKNEPQLDILS